MTHDWTGTKARLHPEDDLQAAIVQHLLITASPDCIWYHPANGGQRSKRTAARLKKLGVVAGVPDLAFVLPDGRPAYIELKAPKGVRSPAQKAFAAKCERLNIEYLCSSNLDQCLEILRAWGVIK